MDAEHGLMSTPALVSEKEFQATVIEMAHAFGWKVYNQLDTGRCPKCGNPNWSKRVGPGFPDLVMAHPERGFIIFAELKSATGQVSKEQKDWLDALSGTGVKLGPYYHPIVRLWRPSDWPEIERILQGE